MGQEAQEILQRLLRVPVVPTDGTGTEDGTHDLEIRWPAGPTWAVEVKMETDTPTREVVSALTRHGCSVETDFVSSRWVVSLLPGANIKSVRAEFPRYLAEVEAQGWSIFVRRFGSFSDAIETAVQRFGVWYGKKIYPEEQSRLLLVPPDLIGSWVRPLDAISGVVSK